MKEALHRLREEPWRQLAGEDGAPLWIKSRFAKSWYAVAVTNLCDVYAEHVVGAEIAQRHAVSNPALLFSSAETTLARLQTYLKRPATMHARRRVEDDGLDVRLEALLGAGTASFRWTFSLDLLAPSEAAEFVRDHLLRPLASASRHLETVAASLFAEAQIRETALASLARRGHRPERSLRPPNALPDSLMEAVQMLDRSIDSGVADDMPLGQMTQWLVLALPAEQELANSNSMSGDHHDANFAMNDFDGDDNDNLSPQPAAPSASLSPSHGMPQSDSIMQSASAVPLSASVAAPDSPGKSSSQSTKSKRKKVKYTSRKNAFV